MDETGAAERFHPPDRRRRRAHREARRPRRHALSARAERLPAHRPRQVRSASTSARARVSAASATCASTTPIPTKEDVEYVDSIKRRRALARLRLGRHALLRLRLLRAALRVRGAADPDGQGLRRQPDAPTRSASTAARSPSRARNSPYRDRPVEENLDLFARMRAGEFPDGAHVLRAKIDMASPNMNLRDPVLYRIRHARASPHRRRVVHLPDVRLRAPALGRDRGHHALALHARVRGPPAALRLGARATAGAVRSRSRSSSRG